MPESLFYVQEQHSSPHPIALSKAIFLRISYGAPSIKPLVLFCIDVVPQKKASLFFEGGCDESEPDVPLLRLVGD